MNESENELLHFWFNNQDFWFHYNIKKDKIIYDKFILHYEKLDLKEPIILNKSTINHYIFIIILCDQISRHISRYLKIPLDKKYHEYARNISNEIINDITIQYDYSDKEICFILMPFRHGESDDLYYCLKLINKYSSKYKNSKYFNRFFKATIRSIYKHKTPTKTKKIDLFHYHLEDQNILCESCQYRKSKEKITSELQSLNKENQKIMNLIEINVKKIIPKNTNITISLSGGVDSMVCLYILKKMNFNINAIHINYCNRKETTKETELLDYYCQFLNIDLFIMKIEEIQRTTNINRNFYEKITKKIRFDCYKYLDRTIVLGHNRDDCLENIFSNIKKNIHYENLNGMLPVSLQNEIKIVRPFLSISKKQILKMANLYNIPYLKDSTPKWSERGKMRDHLIPNIYNFDPYLLNGFLKLSENYQKIYDNYQMMLSEQTKINKIDENNITINYINCYDLDYWNLIFRKLLEMKLILKIPSKKSIMNLCNMLKINRNNKIILLKNLHCKKIGHNIIQINNLKIK